MKSRTRLLWWLLALPALYGCFRLNFDADVLNTLPADMPVVRGLQLHQRYFASANELIILLKAEDAESAAAAARSLASWLRARPALVKSAWWQSPWQESPGQAASLVASAWLNQPPEKLAVLAAKFAPTNLPHLFADARERLATSLSPEEIARLSYDPLGFTDILPSTGKGPLGSLNENSMFAAPDGKARMIMVSARPNLTSYRECERWLAELQQAVARWQEQEKPPLRSIGYTGRPAFMAEIGGGMERDTGGPSLGTLLVIGLLFYLTYRRWRPLLWLFIMLALTMIGTLALGGLMLGTINVVSLGFAAILFGLAEDFGIVMYQEWRAHPELDFAEIKHHAQPGIYWSALTTAGAFLLLNLSGLPGLGQLGTLVAIGIVLAALFMVHLYLPPLIRQEVRGSTWRRSGEGHSNSENVKPPEGGTLNSGTHRPPPLALIGTALLLLAAAACFFTGDWPKFDRSPDALRPKNSDAYRVLDEIKSYSGQSREPLLVVIEADSDARLIAAARRCRDEMARLLAQGIVADYYLPLEFVPNPENVATNARAASALAGDWPGIEQAAAAGGFTSNSLALAGNVLEQFRARAADQTREWAPASRWVMDQFYASANDRRLVLGIIYPAVASESVAAQWNLAASAGAEARLTSWDLLGWSVSRQVLAEIKYLMAAIGALVILSLWLAFRCWREIAFSLLALAASLLLLLVVMRLANWQWNLMNLMAAPLLLGMGVDFSIHILLALRRYQGDLRATHAVVGKALLLAGATTVAAFASLWFSSNAGLASLGQICAVGVLCCQLVAIYLLPAWWYWGKKISVISAPH